MNTSVLNKVLVILSHSAAITFLLLPLLGFAGVLEGVNQNRQTTLTNEQSLFFALSQL